MIKFTPLKWNYSRNMMKWTAICPTFGTLSVSKLAHGYYFLDSLIFPSSHIYGTLRESKKIIEDWRMEKILASITEGEMP